MKKIIKNFVKCPIFFTPTISTTKTSLILKNLYILKNDRRAILQIFCNTIIIFIILVLMPNNLFAMQQEIVDLISKDSASGDIVYEQVKGKLAEELSKNAIDRLFEKIASSLNNAHNYYDYLSKLSMSEFGKLNRYNSMAEKDIKALQSLYATMANDLARESETFKSAAKDVTSIGNIIKKTASLWLNLPLSAIDQYYIDKETEEYKKKYPELNISSQDFKITLLESIINGLSFGLTVTTELTFGLEDPMPLESARAIKWLKDMEYADAKMNFVYPNEWFLIMSKEEAIRRNRKPGAYYGPEGFMQYLSIKYRNTILNMATAIVDKDNSSDSPQSSLKVTTLIPSIAEITAGSETKNAVAFTATTNSEASTVFLTVYNKSNNDTKESEIVLDCINKDKKKWTKQITFVTSGVRTITASVKDKLGKVVVGGDFGPITLIVNPALPTPDLPPKTPLQIISVTPTVTEIATGTTVKMKATMLIVPYYVKAYVTNNGVPESNYDFTPAAFPKVKEWNITLSFMTPGTRSIIVRALDKNGNRFVGGETQPFTVSVKTSTMPAITISSLTAQKSGPEQIRLGDKVEFEATVRGDIGSGNVILKLDTWPEKMKKVGQDKNPSRYKTVLQINEAPGGKRTYRAEIDNIPGSITAAQTFAVDVKPPEKVKEVRSTADTRKVPLYGTVDFTAVTAQKVTGDKKVVRLKIDDWDDPEDMSTKDGVTWKKNKVAINEGRKDNPTLRAYSAYVYDKKHDAKGDLGPTGTITIEEPPIAITEITPDNLVVPLLATGMAYVHFLVKVSNPLNKKITVKLLVGDKLAEMKMKTGGTQQSWEYTHMFSRTGTYDYEAQAYDENGHSAFLNSVNLKKSITVLKEVIRFKEARTDKTAVDTGTEVTFAALTEQYNIADRVWLKLTNPDQHKEMQKVADKKWQDRAWQVKLNVQGNGERAFSVYAADKTGEKTSADFPGGVIQVKGTAGPDQTEWAAVSEGKVQPQGGDNFKFVLTTDKIAPPQQKFTLKLLDPDESYEMQKAADDASGKTWTKTITVADSCWRLYDVSTNNKGLTSVFGGRVELTKYSLNVNPYHRTVNVGDSVTINSVFERDCPQITSAKIVFPKGGVSSGQVNMVRSGRTWTATFNVSAEGKFPFQMQSFHNNVEVSHSNENEDYFTLTVVDSSRLKNGIAAMYDQFANAYSSMNESGVMSMISDQWEAGDGTTLADLSGTLRNTFKIFNTVKCTISNLNVTPKGGTGKYTATYDISISARNFKYNIPHEEKSTVEEEITIENGKPKITKTLSGRFWYVQ